jgi:hypothetical protein
MNFGAEQKQQLVARTLMSTLALFIAVQIFSHSTFAQNQNQPIQNRQTRKTASLALAQAPATNNPVKAAPAYAPPPLPQAAPPYGPPPGQMPPPSGMPPQAQERAYDSDEMPHHHHFMPPFMAPFMPPPGEDTYAPGVEGHRHHGGSNLFGFPHFRHFVNLQVPYVPAFVLLLAISSLLWTLVPNKMAEGVTCIREQFWKSFALGILTMGICMPVVHCLHYSGFGMPLAQFTLGLLQLGLVSGFAIVAAVVGSAVIQRAGGDKFLENHPLEARYLSITIGVAISSLLFLVPAIGIFVGVGNRLVMLNAVLGLGSLVNFCISSNKPS